MPRYNLIEGKCKIRKRGSSASSSASSMLQNYRFKRALLINKIGGSTTPVPRWRLSSRSPGSIVRMVESPLHSGGGRNGNKAPVSARKLAATIWEMNEMNTGRLKENLEDKIVNRESRSRGRGVARSVQSGYLPQRLSDPSHSPVSERLERSGFGSQFGRSSNLSQKIRLNNRKIGSFDSTSNASYTEIEAQSRGLTPASSLLGVKNHVKDLSNGLTTAKELVKILGRMWGAEEHHLSKKSIISALYSELERVCEQVNYLIQEQHTSKKEVKYLMQRFAEEKAAWKKKVHERLENAVKSISNDLEMEKKLRRRTESLTKTLGRELSETKAALASVSKKLESEKRTREIMEQVSDELARGIGEDRELVEQLKKESMKVREEVEKEREMLQLADVLREERVQMKLTEAKYQFEEKNAAVDKLRSELETFLKAKEARQKQSGSHNRSDTVEVGGHLFSKVSAYQNQETGEGDGDIENGQMCKDSELEDDSSESDLHSIELNMDNNNRNYMWNYATGIARDDQRRLSVDKELKGRKSASEKVSRGRTSLERCTSDGIEWDFTADNRRNWGDGYDQGTYSDIEKQAHARNSEVERQRHKSIKELRDFVASRLAPTRGFSSPTKQWREPS